MNHLYFGDSLAILKQLHAQYPEGFIDLVYIDPPFNSKRNYNVLFETVELHDAKAQKEAFADTWSNVSYKDTIHELSAVSLNLHRFLDSLDNVGISQGAVSYLTTMAIRIYYIHKVLKPTGSFYLHCDPTMSHYLKIVCDLIFGEKNFRSEISWQRSSTRSSLSKNYRAAHDIILFYSKTENHVFNMQFKELSEASKALYSHEDERGYYQQVPLLVSGTRNGITGKPWRGIDPNKHGKGGMHWVTVHEKLEAYDKEGKIYWPKEGGLPRLKYYADESPGVPLNDFWGDIKLISASAKESLDYPTQKPEALLERIILASSNKNDLVADFFCGCGTTVAAAQNLKRKWLGVDISHLAIGLIRNRLIKQWNTDKTHENIDITKTFTIDGLPKDIGSAKALAIAPQGRMHFQDWVIETLIGGVSNEKKQGDGGYDGYSTLEIERGKKEIILIEVKSGNIGVSTLRSFHNTIKQQKGSAGILVCFKEQITKGMLSEAKNEGYFREDIYGNEFDKIQILSVEDLLDGKLPRFPRSKEEGPFKKAEKAKSKVKGQNELF